MSSGLLLILPRKDWKRVRGKRDGGISFLPSATPLPMPAQYGLGSHCLSLPKPAASSRQFPQTLAPSRCQKSSTPPASLGLKPAIISPPSGQPPGLCHPSEFPLTQLCLCKQLFLQLLTLKCASISWLFLPGCQTCL